jgi:hypothetical protein
LKCTVDHILQEFYTLSLTRFRTYKIAVPPQTKMTSKDDIKGLVSLSSFVHGYNQLIEAVPLGLSRTSQLRSINCHRTKTFFDFKDFFRNTVNKFLQHVCH